jgi:S-DNA-T family DNA segregation ATPase FtsK/SpoIIIE
MSIREERMCVKINEILSKLPRLNVKVTHVKAGHTYYRCYLQVDPSVRENKIRVHSEFIARELRLEALPTIQTIFSEGAIVIDIPNAERERVDLETCLLSETYKTLVEKKVGLPYVVGIDNSGKEICGNLTEDPHILVAGQSGSGKSNAIRCIVNSLLSTWRLCHLHCGFVYIDPKGVEFVQYKHLENTYKYTNQTGEAVDYLEWLIENMEDRYAKFVDLSDILGEDIYTIEQYNKYRITRTEEPEEAYPYIVVVIDELADLLACEDGAEKKLLKLVQKARACGIHFIVSTQRPDSVTISGSIRANLPTKICCKVSQQVDGKVVFGDSDYGAHHLLGAGDLLYLNPSRGLPIRLQGAYTDPNFIKSYMRTRKKLEGNLLEVISFETKEEFSEEAPILNSPYFGVKQVFFGKRYG